MISFNLLFRTLLCFFLYQDMEGNMAGLDILFYLDLVSKLSASKALLLIWIKISELYMVADVDSVSTTPLPC